MVTNLIFLRAFTVIHRAFTQNYVMIFQDLINIFEVLERKGFMRQRAFGPSAKTIQKASVKSVDAFCIVLADESQRTPLQILCKGVLIL